jgi:hypothetical protein
MSAWWWVLIAAVVAGIIATVLVIRQQGKKKTRASWQSSMQHAVGEGKLITDQLGPTAAAALDRPEVGPGLRRQLQSLDSALVALEGSAPSDLAKQSVAEARRAASELDGSIETDLRVRIGPPAPSDQQLEASRAVIVERAKELDHALERMAGTASAAS